MGRSPRYEDDLFISVDLYIYYGSAAESEDEDYTKWGLRREMG